MKKQYLKILTGCDKGSVYEVSGNRVRIGRDNDNDIIIPKDARCSRQHAFLRLTGSQNEIFNLGKNTIVVNGKRGKNFKIKSGDVIQLGRTQIQFEQENPLRDAKAFKEAAQADQNTQTQDRLFYELDAGVESDKTRTCVTQIKAPDRVERSVFEGTDTASRASGSRASGQTRSRSRARSTRTRRARRKRASATHSANPMQDRKKAKKQKKQAPAKEGPAPIPDFLKPASKPAAPVSTAPVPKVSRPESTSRASDHNWASPMGSKKSADAFSAPVPVKSKRPFMYMGAAALVLWFFFSGGGEKKTDSLRSPADVKKSIEQTQQQTKEQRKIRYQQQTEQYKKAQAAFVQGRRAYNQGQYERAYMSFVACLNLYPRHKLCTRYQHLTKRKKDATVQYHMRRGRHFKEKKQFRQCVSAFKQVMNVEADDKSLVYKEAQANFEACQQQLKGQY